MYTDDTPCSVKSLHEVSECNVYKNGLPQSLPAAFEVLCKILLAVYDELAEDLYQSTQVLQELKL